MPNENVHEELEWEPLFKKVEGTPVAIAKIAYNKNILDCTSQFASLLGFDRTEAKTKNIERDITLNVDKETTSLRFDLMKRGEHISTMKRYKKKDGSTILCFIVAIPMDGWVLEFMHEVNEFASDLEKEIDKLNAIIEAYQQVLTANQKVSITMSQGSHNKQENYADQGASINTGSQSINDSDLVEKALKWTLIPLTLLIAYGFYYMSTIANKTSPEKPDPTFLSPGNNENDENGDKDSN